MRKTIYILLVVALVIFSIAKASSQQIIINSDRINYPSLFGNKIEKIFVEEKELQNLFDSTANKFSITINSAIQLKGTFKVFSQQFPGIYTAIIHCDNRPGIAIIVTMNKKGNELVYTGRIVGFKYNDCYELEKKDEGYFFERKTYEEIITE